jgi:hypothetical protein
MLEVCTECGAIEYQKHKMSCDSKKLFDSYLHLRDNPLTGFTNEMLVRLGFRIWCEEQDRALQINNEENL